jgi:hypothetical protein
MRNITYVIKLKEIPVLTILVRKALDSFRETERRPIKGKVVPVLN